jgi:eukaryotic-like serine/threonine-protein kinase
VVVLAAVWVLHPAAPSPTTAAAPAKPATGPVGDPHTADPCSLTDASSLSRYGRPQLVTDYGNFNRCDVLLTPTGGDDSDQVDVRLELDAPGEDSQQGAPVQHTSVPSVNLRRLVQQQDDCERVLLLPQGYQIDISTAFDGDYQALDLCGMADAVTTGALVVLGRGPIPRRTPLPAASLAQQDACALLTPADYTPVLGKGPIDRTPGFAGWDCDWVAHDGPDEVLLTFDRTNPGSLTDGTHQRIGDRDAYLFPDADDSSCELDLATRTFTDSAGQPTDDVLEIVVSGNGPGERFCAPATKLATAAASRLPRAS